ncbi:hypothetical protein ICN30_08205 [Polynucleobacter sp. 31A-FELB]|uniref:hypothetical protein n=1 Tax=Polynucleobacter sp. 31A-FELB TaxID=2689096 RepID=UPI001C0B1F4A|nr:hypothetical protein [Polynucleobacter sp. 31A-FELB]MBU3587814.1 hypothetical protein [Polynucleobacter sp. 31A-FELB]
MTIPKGKPKITNPNLLLLKHIDGQDELKTSTDYYLSQATLGASTAKVMGRNGALDEDQISLEYTKELLERHFKDVANGELAIAEQMLITQAFALNVAFNSLSVRAARQKDASTMQMIMNLCFKAQNQSRATLDSLVQLKRPNQTSFIKQANIANGHQQVINSGEKNITPQNELLERSNGKRLDRSAKTKAKRIDSTVEAVGKIDGRENPRRKS